MLKFFFIILFITSSALGVYYYKYDKLPSDFESFIKFNNDGTNSENGVLKVDPEKAMPVLLEKVPLLKKYKDYIDISFNCPKGVEITQVPELKDYCQIMVYGVIRNQKVRKKFIDAVHIDPGYSQFFRISSDLKIVKWGYGDWSMLRSVEEFEMSQNNPSENDFTIHHTKE